MKYRHFNHWINSESLSGLAYFSQVIDEMLFDYALDSYKPSAMNAPALCGELIAVYRDVDKGVLNDSHIRYVTNELSECLKKDPVVAGLLDVDVNQCIKVISCTKTPKDRKIATVEFVSSRISLPVYKDEAQRLLVLAVSEDDRSLIRALSRSYVTCLINIGFNRSYIYSSGKRSFHYGRRVSSIEDIKHFFDFFSAGNNKYNVFFGVSGHVTHIKDGMEGSTFEVLSIPESGLTNDQIEKIGECEHIVAFKSFVALDEFSARQEAEDRVELIFSIASLFHHKARVIRSARALVQKLDKDDVV